jgi:hypothetical protein
MATGFMQTPRIAGRINGQKAFNLRAASIRQIGDRIAALSSVAFG